MNLFKSKEIYFYVAIFLISFATRIFPHAWNFTSIGALFLFAGLYIRPKSFSLIVPIAIMMTTDLVLGLHSTLFYVYGAFLLTGILGLITSKKLNQSNTLNLHVKLSGYSLLSSSLFFIITNFGVWHMESFYSKDFSGLISCYLMALPFFGQQIIADLIYVNAFVFSFYVLQNKSIFNQRVVVKN